MNFFRFVKKYATYKEIVGSSYDKTELERLVSQLPLGGVLSILSQLSSMPINDNYVRSAFIKHIDKIDPRNSKTIKNKIQNHHLYTHQVLLNVWKWMLAFGDEERLLEDIEFENGISIVIFLCLVVSDYQYSTLDSDGLVSEIARNAMFNSFEDLGSSISRSAHIYFDLARTRQLYDANEYLDFNREFEQTKGYSLLEYFSVLFGVITAFIYNNSSSYIRWGKNLFTFFGQTRLAAIAPDIIMPLTTTFAEGQEWARQTIDSPWDFTLFSRKSLFLLPNNDFIPINKKLLDEQIFAGTFHVIRHCYSETDTRFLSFFGRPFEKYVENLMKDSSEMSYLPYNFIEEFRFGNDMSKKSPDAMLQLGNKLLVVEAKGIRPRLDTLIGNDNDSIRKDMHRLVLAPAQQAHKCLSELKLTPDGAFLDQIDEIYLIIVTHGEFPTLPPLERQIDEYINNNFTLPIKNIFHVNIEEYEMICNLIGRPKKTPIFKVLDLKNNIAPNIPLKNFLLAGSYHPRRPKAVHNRGIDFMNEIQRILFPH